MKKINTEKIINEIASYKYVSFDLFDTLIKRNVENPTALFDFVELKLESIFGKAFDGFSKSRIQAERMARQKTKGEEVTIEQIYEGLSNQYSKEILDRAKQIEYNLELQFCQVNVDMISIYRKCVSDGKKIFIITDIYFPQEFINKLLEKNGFTYRDAVYSSAEIGLTKRTGNLFRYVLENQKISSDELIHIGDNRKSDYVIPRKMGIKSICIPSVVQHLSYAHLGEENLNDKCVKAFINNNLLSVRPDMRSGYECMGPLLYGFAVWLYHNLLSENIKDVFFLSRDGYILKKAFDKINPDKSIRSTYFYASRRALRVPMLARELSYQEYIERNYWPQVITMGYFLHTLGIEENEKEICKNQDIPYHYSISRDDILNDDIFLQAYKKLKNIVKVNAISECENLVHYIRQENMNGKFAIIDIGWHGNMQYNLLKIFREIIGDSGVDIKGYYVGISKVKNHKDEISMKGYCFDGDLNSDLFDLERNVNELFEQIFLAPHGSVKTYCLSDNKIEPVFYELEQTDIHSKDILESYQNGALEFVDAFSSNFGLMEISGRYAISGILKQFTAPTWEDAINWGNIVFKDVDERKVITAKNKKYYFKHPGAFFMDYKRSIWKEGFLRVTLKRDMDYYRICQWIIQMRKWFYFRKRS